MDIDKLFRFQPIYQPRVWGGRTLADKLDRNLPGEGPIGESWEITDRPEAQSVDPDSGKTLRQLLSENAEAIMGPNFNPEQPFPILVKWLDCMERLSLQVHPPEHVAASFGGEPKTECWYIAEAAPEAALIVGLRNGVTRAEFEQAILQEQLEPLLHRFAVKRGQSILLESGRLHAIDAGNLILEIQQNSDTTYRVYDWGRKGLDGKPRDLHVNESLHSIDFKDFEPQPKAPFTDGGEHMIADCDKFRLRQINIEAKSEFTLPACTGPSVLSIIEGSLIDQSTGFKHMAGENLLSPWCRKTRLIAQTPTILLITDRFVQAQSRVQRNL